MKLRVKHNTNEILIAEVIEQIFKDTYIEDFPKVFYYDEGVAKNNIESAIKYVLGYDDDADLNYVYEKEDLDTVRNKVLDIMYSITQADKESE